MTLILSRGTLRRMLPTLAIALAFVGVGSASAATPQSSLLGSDPPSPLPSGYVEVVDETGQITVAVPETWTDIDTSQATNNDGTPAPRIAASTDLVSYTETFDTSGVVFVALAYEADPQVVIDANGLVEGCETIEIQPYSDPVFTGLAQVGTNCGDNGAIWNMVVASPADQSLTAVVQVLVTPADAEAMDIVLRTFDTVRAAPSDVGRPGSSTAIAPGSNIPYDLVGEYHRVRGINTNTSRGDEQIRVLVFYWDATYEFWIEPLGYYESGQVFADQQTIEFVADTEVDPEWTFSGRGPAQWSFDEGEILGQIVGRDLTMAFSDGRGYNYDGYDQGTDVYFPCEQAGNCIQ